MTSNIVLSNTEFKVVGKRPIRHDGYDKVTGKAKYGADVHLPGLLHGKVLNPLDRHQPRRGPPRGQGGRHVQGPGRFEGHAHR